MNLILKMVESKKKDFYGELEIQKTATQAEIKTAYKKLALVSEWLNNSKFRNGIQISNRKDNEMLRQRSSKQLVKLIQCCQMKNVAPILTNMVQ